MTAKPMTRGQAEPVYEALKANDADLEARWQQLSAWVKARFGKVPDIEGLLFLIGIQSRGRGFEPKLQKEVKQGVIMEGTCCAFASLGIYERVGMEDDGSWIWERIVPNPPGLSVEEQEKLLRVAILRYFEDIL